MNIYCKFTGNPESNIRTYIFDNLWTSYFGEQTLFSSCVSILYSSYYVSQKRITVAIWLAARLIRFERQQPTSGGTVRSSDLQIVVNTSFQTVSSTVFRTRVSLQRLSWLITHQSRNDPRTPRDHGNASCSQEMYTRTLALLQSIHVRCVLAMLQVVGWAIYAIVVLVGYIRSVLVFKTQQSIDELRTGFAALAIPHPLYRNYNHHQFQHKLSMRIHSPSCNSTQMASATNWRN